MNKDLIIVGYSGHSFGVAESWLENGGKLRGYLDFNPKKFNPFNITYLGNDDYLLNEYQNEPIHLSFGDIAIRKAWLRRNTGIKNFQTIISKDANLSPNVFSIGNGTFIARGASLNSFVLVGENCILNTSCSIDHEVEIGNNCHIGPGAVIAGNVKISNNVFIGANATIKENILIEENSIIGAGSVVVKSIQKNKVVVGNPARNLNK